MLTNVSFLIHITALLKRFSRKVARAYRLAEPLGSTPCVGDVVLRRLRPARPGRLELAQLLALLQPVLHALLWPACA